MRRRPVEENICPNLWPGGECSISRIALLGWLSNMKSYQKWSHGLY